MPVEESYFEGRTMLESIGAPCIGYRGYNSDPIITGDTQDVITRKLLNEIATLNKRAKRLEELPLLIPFARATNDACNLIATNTPEPGDPNIDTSFKHRFKLYGQQGQGTFFVDIPIERVSNQEYRVLATGNVQIPRTLKGMFKVQLYMVTGADYPAANIFDEDDVSLTGVLASGNVPSDLSPAFDIKRIARIEFSCTNSN